MVWNGRPQVLPGTATSTSNRSSIGGLTSTVPQRPKTITIPRPIPRWTSRRTMPRRPKSAPGRLGTNRPFHENHIAKPGSESHVERPVQITPAHRVTLASSPGGGGGVYHLSVDLGRRPGDDAKG